MYTEKEAERIYNMQLELAYARMLYAKLERATKGNVTAKPSSLLLENNISVHVVGRYVGEEEEIDSGSLDRIDSIIDMYNPFCSSVIDVVNLESFADRIDIAERFSEKNPVKEACVVTIQNKKISTEKILEDSEKYIEALEKYAEGEIEDKEEVEALAKEMFLQLVKLQNM